MVITHLFAIRRRSSPMTRRDKLWSFCAFCHPEVASPMTGEDKLWSFAHLFAIRRRSCPMARRDKLWSFCAFCHPEAVGPVTCEETIWSHTFFHFLETIKSDSTHRQIMVIRTLLLFVRLDSCNAQRLTSSSTPFVIQGQRVGWWAEIPYGHPRLSSTERQSCPMARRDKLWSFCAFCNLEVASPMTCGDKLWSFHTFFSIRR